MELNKAYNIDVFEGMKQLEDNSVNLIILDPPYNIGKDKWDKFESPEKYMDFMASVMKESQRVLKDNGSLYLWHNKMDIVSDFMQMIKNDTEFVFKNMITWNKRFDGGVYKEYLDGFVSINQLRNYRKMCEYCLFYTLQDGVDEDVMFLGLKEYLRDEKSKSGMTLTDLNELLVGKRQSDCIAKRYFGNSLWMIPTKEMYEKLQTTGFWQRTYEDIKGEYEGLRYTFNNQKTHHSVWNYPIEKSKYHITPKNIEMCKNIILHSSNKDDIVLIPFLGSGSECKACKMLSRNYIAFDTNEEYVEIFNDDIKSINEIKEAEDKDNLSSLLF